MKTKQTTIAKEWEKEWAILSDEIVQDVASAYKLLKRVEAQTRATTLDACLAVIGEDEKEDALNEGTRYNAVRNNLRHELRQAINLLKVTKK